MVVQFTKHSDKAPTLTCIRNDGSTTWFRAGHNGEFFVAHDLLHFAVESILGYSTAFYGMVAAGRDLNDFGSQNGVPDERKYSAEALKAEHIVGLIQVLFPPGVAVDHAVFSNANETFAINLHDINEAQLTRIHTKWCQLIDRWHSTTHEVPLRLEFP
jgi:hypothetical protein